MKAIIVDDEYYALQGLRMELEEIGDIEVAGTYEDGYSMLAEINTIQPDIIFLDIEMPKMNGLELFERILEVSKTPNVIFVTAYDHYAVQAFEINALDYIIKPVTRARLIKTLERVKPSMGQVNKNKIVITCFRHLSILVDGQEINKGWRTKKAEELIAYLLCEKGNYVSKEKIADALWPVLDREKSVSNLYLAYYYIKKLQQKTGVKIPIESERGKMRIQLADIDCDMAKFDSYIVSCNSDDDNLAIMETAIELYQGMLLEDSYYSWIVEIQQRYEIEYEKLLRRLIKYYGQRKNLTKLKYYGQKLNRL